MSKKCFMKQIVRALGQATGDEIVGKIFRQLGISEQGHYIWKRKREGLSFSEL